MTEPTKLKTLYASFQRRLQTFSDYIDKICKPNPKYNPSISQQEIEHKRNKTAFISYMASSTGYSLLALFAGVTGKNSIYELVTAAFCITVLIVLVLSSDYHPQIFKTSFNFLITIYGSCMVYKDPQAVSVILIMSQIFPIFVQMLTGSYRHFFFQSIFQIIIVNTAFQGPLSKLLTYSTPESVLQSLTFATNICHLLQMSLITHMGSYMEQTGKQAMHFEMKKNEAESQKVFLLGFSHELRNLINSLTGNVKLASFETMGDKARDLLRNAEVCGELLLHMINNILDTGKTQIGELEVDLTPTQTYDAFERIWGICSELIRRKDLKGNMKIPRNLPQSLMMDHHRLTQIFLNLVGNAIKFTQKGSVNIKVEWIPDTDLITEDCFKPYPFNDIDDQDEGLFEKEQSFSDLNEYYITLTSGRIGIKRTQLMESNERNKGVLKLIVCDTGCGMTQQQLQKLFHKFSQVTSDESKKKLGTGLGLYITKQLCEKMGGEIRVYSQKDRGSSFIFCLPTQPVEERSHFINDIESIRSILSQRRLQALIVDDAMSNHDILKIFFEKLNIRVKDIALNGLEAVNKYSRYVTRGEILQIVTMDLDMPIMDGKEAARKIREMEKEKRLAPCFMIIISGNCVESEVHECIDPYGKIRANSFMRKPIRMDDLARIVISHFDQGPVPGQICGAP